ncbi:MAG: type III polyketide synthase [Intrasporangium sp.]|uniref:type III polyketide synthase n=1 Tax=Intrasporangium sp. TaxID=1925024 RepID=UPI0026473D77|nr:3-oxoacyl-[acyl-carrier-protein] synthase III C-terminal domain-containing protein [Intrasporangium sp.]MDN5796984.1 type III polyketide synthase [Intrasporangium sp.]
MTTTHADPVSHLAAATGVLPEHRHSQARLTRAVADMLGLEGADRVTLESFHANAGVSERYLVMPIERYAELGDFGERNDLFLERAVTLGERAVKQALAAAAVEPGEVDVLITTTITGLAVPSLDARLVGPLGLRDDVKRIPLVGLGCVAGAAGIARAHDHLVGHPDDVVALLAIELCSLTIQQQDASTPNLVASGLFGDGAGAVVLTGADRAPARPGPRVRATRSRLYPDTERAMGWDVRGTGMQIVLGAEVPGLVRENVRGDVDRFLADHGLTRRDIGWWVAHPGGPKVLDALADALEIPAEALGVTWRSLDRVGNLSSASVLHVLADTLADRPPAPGGHGVLLAMGPGFCLELVLLEA